MTISDSTESNILKLIFQAVAWANYADNAASAAESNISYALHTADPGEGGDQTTSETTYTSYARVNSARTAAGHPFTAGPPSKVSPGAALNFPAGTGGSGTITYFSTGKASVATTAAILWSGSVSPTITVGSGITPQLTTGTQMQLD